MEVEKGASGEGTKETWLLRRCWEMVGAREETKAERVATGGTRGRMEASVNGVLEALEKRCGELNDGR